MASVKYQIIGKTEIVQIYLRLSVSRNITPRAKTFLHIAKKDWSSTSKFPKTNSETNKTLKNYLQKLEIFILEEVNNNNPETITREWLKNKIDIYFGRITETQQSDLLTDAIQTIINEAPTRKNAKGGLGLSKSRVKALISFRNIILEYQKHKSYRVKDVNLKFGKDFLNYLLKQKEYQKSTALKKLADLKMVCNDASFYGIETNTRRYN